MEVAFFTEMGFKGKVPRNHPNMRTEFAWMVALNADHYNLQEIPQKEYDLAIVINSKNHPEYVNIKKLKPMCKKVAVMQEGPFWYFQDYELPNQIHYFNSLMEADLILVHNEQDRSYYKGLTGKTEVEVLSSLMIEDPIGKIYPVSERTGVMIGGNFKSWYGGFDSFMIAKSITDEIYSPNMGRRSEGEEQLGITKLPYVQWDEWITELSKRKIGVHLMRTHAAGTFALNCAYLGIPCVGYKGLNTQQICHPNLTVSDGDLEEARYLIKKLNENEEFYKQCSNDALLNYKECYHESKWKHQFTV